MAGSSTRRDIVVLGAGATGLATALLLVRAGQRVTLVDREGPPPDGDADTVFEAWERRGVGHFQQPHNFLGRAQQLLAAELPDVLADLETAGAGYFVMTSIVPPFQPTAGDELLRLLLVRRPVYDAVLRRACEREPGITAETGTVHGLVVDDTGRRVVGVGLADGRSLAADLVVDAMGRTSPVPGWVEQLGLATVEEEHSDCGLLYYSRHYRFPDGLPPAVSPMYGPRGDTGSLAYATFVGDADTASACLMVSAEAKEMRGLRDAAAWDAVAGLLPGLAEWTQGEISKPVTGVLPMGQIRNMRRTWTGAAGPGVPGLQPVGDALCHTNPTFALGASQALEHAVGLRDALEEVADLDELAAVTSERYDETARRRYATVAAEDKQRLAWWRGELASATDRSAPELRLRFGLVPVSWQDPEIFRAVLRRISALDPIDRLASDPELMARADALIDSAPPASGPAPPSRADLIEAVSSAASG